MDYLRDPQAIYAQSFATIRAECDLSRLPEDAHDIAIRMVHACGMPDIVQDIAVSAAFPSAARKAITAGKPVFVDAEMVRQGVITNRDGISCLFNDPRAKDIGIRQNTTRSAAAVELWLPQLEGCLAVIGNAPTALFRLLELIEEHGKKPAAIIGLPVGFVGAAESKRALETHSYGIPFLTLRGRRGGTAMAAAAINALMKGLS